MGNYLNPGNDGFRQIRNGGYVDKTGLIKYINQTIETTPGRLTSFSRPRRFGKSFAAKMLCAYYDKSCDSGELFAGLEAEKAADFETYLNKFDVIYLDITWFIARARSRGENVVAGLQKAVIGELQTEFPGLIDEKEVFLPDALLSVAEKTGNKFIIIIDEWDALFREEKDDTELLENYVILLRGLFKGGTTTDKMIAAAYMTGILPIKKYGNESTLSDFQEYTMANPDALAPYVGFTEQEVLKLCAENGMDFEEMKFWYDGYSFKGVESVYNPNSVMSAIRRQSIRNYWISSSSYESLAFYISMDYKGLKQDVVRMLGGKSVRVKITTFQNDLTSLKSKDDVFTLLIHLGYLRYNENDKTVTIPNQEIADVFGDAVEGEGWDEIGEMIRESEDLLDATIRQDAVAVVEALEKVHNANSSVLRYNNEAALSSAIMIAYYTAKRIYKIVPEFPQGKGFAELVFLPRRGTDKPVLLVELKVDKNANSAIRQIHENKYEGDLKKYFGNLLLVGINYDKNARGKRAKRHTCVIEKV
ncbi:MAG: AAA family ATPase [Lachnospiraceae bacterium]|nr:AAA family ATPase [Lachnospiraceae bacterium]